jgi:hypothetical protein
MLYLTKWVIFGKGAVAASFADPGQTANADAEDRHSNPSSKEDYYD